MRNTSVWQRVLGLTRAVVEDVRFDESVQAVVVSVRPRRSAQRRCGRCGRRGPWFDRGEGRRRWRALDVGTVQVLLEADAGRVNCPDHGPTVAHVPWARHAVGHTYAFDQQVAWLATQCSKSAITELMRVAWRTVGAIVTRVWADTAGRVDLFAGLRRIGIDEISYKRGYKFLTVVVDHDTGRLVWAASGRDRATLRGFFEALGSQRCSQISHVSADGADWIADVVAEYCGDAELCADPFHVVRWATDALDEIRRQAWNDARRAPGGTTSMGRAHGGRPRRDATGHAKALKRARWALWKNPEHLTARQHAKLEWIAKNDPRLYRAYLLKEGLRLVFQLPYDDAVEALDRWTCWASRSRLDAFIALGKRIRVHRDAILAAIEYGLSNGRIESVNTKIRLITRIAFGFHSTNSLIALAMLQLAGHRPTLPGRV